MEKVNTNTSNNYQKLNINGNQNVYQVSANSTLNKDEVEKVKYADKIEINEKNDNIINVKKAHDAFKEACSEFGTVQTSMGGSSDMSYYYNTVVEIMKSRGIPVSTFVLDGQNNSNFLDFIDKVKDFAKELSISNPNFLPDGFSNFCDLFKDKLTQYGCR
ncbi:hypothetical protein [Desnuesiella massiliensis]|uniref:hypothetical protein n=1 Tax=Desnuesiella massiliensis TaxID=1650662 RepID=UPI0006E1A9AA|nr:hypothetical protein [Desnuesiella massiliensis]